MATFNSWIVCETSGRWAAALRLALARHRHLHIAIHLPQRVREARTLAEIDAALREYPNAFPLIEVRRQNFAESLTFIASLRDHDTSLVALLDASILETQSRSAANDARHAPIVAALLEAGALDALETPRQFAGVLELVTHWAKAQARTQPPADLATLAEFAHAALPWQDA